MCEMPKCLDMITDIRSYVYDMFMCDGCEEWFHLNRVGLKLPSPDSLLINGTVVQHVKHSITCCFLSDLPYTVLQISCP